MYGAERTRWERELAADLAMRWEQSELATRALLGAAAVRLQYGPFSEIASRLERLWRASIEATTLKTQD